MPTIVVIGAGISGLTVARALSAAGHKVIVLDRGNRCGGRMHSERIGGFLMEHGPNGMVFPAPCAERLVDGLGLGPQTVARSPAAATRCLVRGGRVCRIPPGIYPVLSSGLLSPAGWLRVLLEPLAPACIGDESIAEFARRRFGREFLDYVMDPLVGGLYAGNPEQLSVMAVFPHLKRLERLYGSVILAAMASRLRPRAGRAPGDFARRVLVSLRSGLGMLPLTLARHLTGNIFLNTHVESIRRAPGGGFAVAVRERRARQSLRADSVVIALPAYAAARVVDRLDAHAAEKLAQIGHPPIAVVFLGYRAQALAHPLDAAGVLAPAVEGRDVLGMLFSSTLFGERAPPGHVAVTAFVGGARQPHLALRGPDEIAALVREEAHRLLGLRGAPVIERVCRWRQGLPQPGLEHAGTIETLKLLERGQPGLFFSGNYLAGISVPDCIGQATVIAARTRSYLATVTGRQRTKHPVRWSGTPLLAW